MNNQNPSSVSKTKNITLTSIIGWAFGILFGIAGLAGLFSSPIVGIFFILASIVLIPPLIKKISGKFVLSRGVKILLVLIFLVLAGVSIKSDPSSVSIESTSTSTIPVTNYAVSNTNETKNAKVTQVNQTTSTTTIKSPVSSIKQPISTETISQKNAVRKAKSYLNYTAFSYDGLIKQLEFEKFSNDDAVYGADHSGANWNEQAAKKAKSYMGYSSFSRGSLIEQLLFDKFTQEQAEYGVNAVGL